MFGSQIMYRRPELGHLMTLVPGELIPDIAFSREQEVFDQ